MAPQDVAEIRRDMLPLRHSSDLDPLLERVGAARLVLIGEATHGTSEFYRWRAALARRLVAEKAFSFIGVEGDWPDCHAVHCSVVGGPDAARDPHAALAGFDRWPRWMWANEEVADFARWLRAFNDERPSSRRVGFHGLDVYSLFTSLHAVLDYLAEHEPDHLPAAQDAMRCFEPFAESPQDYAMATRSISHTCEDEVIALLRRLREPASSDATGGGALDARFVAEQNAEAAAGAERYYRAMIGGGPESWNASSRCCTRPPTAATPHSS